jgi:hypothetical protein
MPQDKTPVGDAMTHRFPEQTIPEPQPGAPESIPPVGNGDSPPAGDEKPKAPPANDEPGVRHVPVELPGKPHAPERA